MHKASANFMWFRKTKTDKELNTELQYHLESLIRDLIAAGVSPGEAKRRARLEFGGLEQVREACRDVRGRWLEDFAADLRYAARALRRSPAFLAVSVISLALGIGANTAIFSLIDVLMLRSLPVKNPQQLVHITRVDENGQPMHVSWQLFQTFRNNLKSISVAAAERRERPVIFIDRIDELVDAALVSGDQYRLLGLEPAAGRLLEPADDALATASPAAVISYRFWERRFNLNPAAIGKTFTVQGHQNPFTIVGVTPPSYHGLVLGKDPDITLPLALMLNVAERSDPTYNNLKLLGRLTPGVTAQHANAELQVVWRGFQNRIAASLPEKDRPIILRQHAAVLAGSNGFDPLRYQYSEALLVLMSIVGMVLLLACVNLSGLMLARAVSREREVSIRLAIGASRGRLIRQFLTESFVLAALGGTLGLLAAQWFTKALVQTMSAGDNVMLSTAPDWRVLIFTAGISLVACVLAGLAPGLHGLRASLNLGIRQHRGVSHQRIGRTLVIAQLSISMVLVTGAALFSATLLKLYRVDRGLRTEGVLTFGLQAVGACPPARCRPAVYSFLDHLSALSGVASATAVNVLPVSGSLWDRDIQVEGRNYRSGQADDAAFNAVAPKYFATVETPLLQGREFNSHDTGTSRKVTIVNETFARNFFGTASPLGRTVKCNDVSYQIVGVAADAKYTDLKQPSIKTMYIAWTQLTDQEPTDSTFLVRVKTGDPMRFAPMVEKLARQADATLRLNTPTAWSTVADRTIVTERMMAALGAFFGALALIVGCIGIFGVMQFRVSRRINEIGVRIALGASRSGIVALVLREAAAMLLAGCLIGALTALSLARLTRAMLFEVSPADPGAFAFAACILLLAGLAAGWLPAQRAAQVDAVKALRYD